ncbi:MAG TPA: M20/M25/M40 family metallo-hydrolase [Pyrinomonadaceae bacterium]|nr:M20/M25/M40 family metallo-hydrolase [Pyrinomonadaceae bacterium]
MKSFLQRTLLRRIIAAVCCVVLLSAAVAQQPATSTSATLSADEQALANAIKTETIKTVTEALSADDMQGRGTMQPGGEKAAAYIADRFAKLGLKPLGNKDTFLQAIKFREIRVLPDARVTVGDNVLSLGRDFYLTPPFSGSKKASGDLVFVAYGLDSTRPKRDDLAGVDVAGKMIVLLNGPPKDVSPEAWKKAEIQSGIIRNLVMRGANGLIFVNTQTPQHSYAEMSDYMTRRFIEPNDAYEAPSLLPPFIAMSDDAAAKLFENSGTTFAEALARADQPDFKPIKLKQSAKIDIPIKKSTGSAQNVIGYLEGSDPKLKEEALVYTAHYDAFGVGADNRIYRGAADNALGVGEMLAVAEAFTQSTVRPRRSIIFMAVTGEEYGGHGTAHWVSHPTWSLKKVVANLNFDGMGTEVYGPVKTLVGYGAEHSTLGTILKDVAGATELEVIPDPMPEEKSFYRSDHYYFVKRGVPGIMVLGAPGGKVSDWTARMKEWSKTDYHQPTDIIRPNWNWDGPRTMAVLGAVMGWRISNNEAMVSWMPNSPFNKVRGTKEDPPPEP